jgi:elongator complex protein 5
VSFETLRIPRGVHHFIRAISPSGNLSPSDLQRKILAALNTTKRRYFVLNSGAPLSHLLIVQEINSESHLLLTPDTGSLIILDTLHPLLTSSQIPSIPTYLSSLTATPTTSLLALYHTDVPLAASVDYSPSPFTLLRYMATTILEVRSFHHVLVQKAARDRSVGEPLFGLEEGIEGVMVGLREGLISQDQKGVVIEMEYRRKSGRAVSETFFLPYSKPASSTSKIPRETVTLLEDHPLYARPPSEVEDDGVESSFDLNLTEKQRRDREGVVLPYFDAQSQGGAGEGGRILYDLGVEDDFDEEEDEI